jgi:DTW domain-containing protein YfiP
VVFLQHPRERRVAIGTARMAHLSLVNSELHSGVTFEGSDRLRQLLAQGDSALLFPSEGALPPNTFRAKGFKNLVVVDGTWPQAKKMLKSSPLLASLPRIGLVPQRPGNYRIRKEPEEHCRATIEAVSEVLGQIEGDDSKFLAMLRAFDLMVDHQIACTQARQGPSRHRHRRGERTPPIPAALLAAWERLVLVHGEGNAQGQRGRPMAKHELIHLAALRPSTGEQFEALLAPRAPLYESTPFHLEVPRERFAAAEPVDAALGRFKTFLGEGGVAGCWGTYTKSLLENEGLRLCSWLDLRLLAAGQLKRRPGDLEALSNPFLSELPGPFAMGRTGRRLQALSALAWALRRGGLRRMPGANHVVDALHSPPTLGA